MDTLFNLLQINLKNTYYIIYLVEKYTWNHVSINLYNLCLDNKNEIIFVTDDTKTLFRASQ